MATALPADDDTIIMLFDNQIKSRGKGWLAGSGRAVGDTRNSRFFALLAPCGLLVVVVVVV